MKSLKNYILISTFVASIAALSAFFVIGSNFFEDIAQKKALETSEVISKQVFNSMYQVMKRGWSREDMNEFISSTKNAFENSSLSVEIYRAPLVVELFGEYDDDKEKQPDLVASALRDGELRRVADELNIQFLYPIKAQNECLQCHTNASVGDILGLIETKQYLAATVQEAKNDFYLFLLFLVPVPLIAAYINAKWVNGKIDSSIESFQQEITKVNSVKDLRFLELGKKEIGFKELNKIYEEVGVLTSKLKDIAADKDLLEFEVKLLDKFIITSDVVKDWQEHILTLLFEINTIMEVYNLFVIFKVEEEGYDLEIFWIATPEEDTKKMFEESVKARIKENPYFSDVSSLVINHNICEPDTKLKPLTQRDIELQTKSLIMATPKIGGVVGIGVQSLMSQDPTRYIVIESILTTLINVVGSVKAIYKYTKDLEYYATRDPLTALYNQRVFRELLTYEIIRAKRNGYKFGVMVIDFDNFKLINDKYGHTFGDEFLQVFASGLRDMLRKEDIIARYGGDEFVVILPETDSEQVFMISTKVREGIEALTLTSPSGDDVHATVSIGYSVYPEHGKDDKELFMIADNMMYKAKKSGKNRVAAPTEEDILESFKIAGEKTQLILNTLQNKNLLPFFQPIKNLVTGEVEIYELLMRIQKGDDIISAFEFIDVAESLGVIHKLDYILIEKAFMYIHETNYEGLLFVNISPKALIIGEFVQNILSIAKKYAINPRKVVFEITERDTVKNMTLLEKFVRELKFEGFKFAIDDFGSGFSSFHYLKRLPIDYIKIEGEFIKNVVTDKSDKAFICSILTLAKEMGINTIGEFVEDAEIYEEIKTLGVTYGQGYFIGRPNAKMLV